MPSWPRSPSNGLARPASVIAGLVTALVAVLVAALMTAATTIAAPLEPAAAASTCVVTELLVNPCRPWLGVASANYPNVATGLLARTQNAETNTGRPVDVPHAYDKPGTTLSGDALTLAQRANTFLMLNWQPAATFADGNGGNPTINTQIDAMARSIEAIAPKKLFLTVWHEPEDDVSSGSANCGASFKYPGKDGTPADYVAMWHNVRSRFDALGVDNVVWVINYMSYVNYNCLQKELWPGNDLVDWVTFDTYVHNTGPPNTFAAAVGTYYNWLTANSDATHDFVDKPWGVNEWGTNQTPQAKVYQTYADAKTALDNNTYPKIKLWDFFDEIGPAGDYRSLYNNGGPVDQTEQADYNAFANDPNITGAFTGPGPSAPILAADVSSPDGSSTLRGTVSVEGALTAGASPLAGAQLVVDGQPIGAAISNPDPTVSFDLDTTTLTPGGHTIAIQVTDQSGATVTSDAVSVTVDNSPLDVTPPSSPTDLTVEQTTTSTVDLSWQPATDDVAVTGYLVLRGGNVIAQLGADATTYTDSGLAAQQSYTYAVEAVDAAGNVSQPTDDAIALTQGLADVTAPTPPSSVTATVLGGSSVQVSWQPSSDDTAVVGYDLYRDGTQVARVTDGSDTALVSGLTDARTYSFTVDAYDAAGNVSGLSAVTASSAATTPDTESPSTPTGLITTVQSANSVSLTWAASTDNVGVTAYEVFRNSKLINTVGNVSIYQDNSAAGGTAYQYSLIALDAAGNLSAVSAPTSAITPAKPDTTKPTVPKAVTANASKAGITLTWTASTDNVKVTGYNVYRGTVLLGTTTTPTYLDSVVTQLTKYSYTISAFDAAGNVSAKSTAATATALDITPPSAPTGVKAVAASKKVTLTWKASTDNVKVASYKIYRGTTLAGTVAGTVLTFTNTGLTTGTTYSWTIVALDAAGNVSAASPAVVAKVK